MAIELTPLHSTLGAEVRGVDLTRPVMPEVFAEIDAAFNRHGILVFPGQPVTDEQQLAFSRLFGPLEQSDRRRRRAHSRRRSRWRRYLAPDRGRCRSAGQPHAVRTTALIGTDP